MSAPLRALIVVLPAAHGCAWLEEQRAAPSEVYWSGYVLDGPNPDTGGLFEEGSFEVVDLEDAPVATAEPVDGSPGGWAVYVPVDTDVAIRLSGETYASTVWRAHTPTGRAYWYQGALFARKAEDVLAFYDELFDAELVTPHPDALREGGPAQLWGTPLDPEAWAGASIVVQDGDGQPAQILAMTIEEDGSAHESGRTDPIDLFFAFDLAPGDVTLTVTADAGAATEHFPARAGDLLNPTFFALGPPQ